MEKEEIIREVLDVIYHRLPRGDVKVLLFGSWAKDTAAPTSDIDIGILGPSPIDEMLLLRIKGEIRAIPTLGRIDIVDLNRSDESFREEVLSYAKVL